MTLYADYSFLSAYRSCPRKFYYGYERGLVSKHEPPYLVGGRAIHAALDVLHTSGWDVEAAVDELHREWGDYQAPGGDLSWLTREHCAAVVRNYARERENINLQTIRLSREELNEKLIERIDAETAPDGTLRLAESPLCVRWTSEDDDETLLYAGKIDKPATDGHNLYIVDYKCTIGWLNNWYMEKKVGIGHQLRGYTAMMELLTGKRFAGAYIEGIYMGKKALDPPEKWKNRKSDPFRLFGPWTFSRAHLEETRRWALETLREIEWRREVSGDDEMGWPQNDQAGCTSCPFFEMCMSQPRARKMKAKIDYNVREMTGMLASGADSEWEAA